MALDHIFYQLYEAESSTYTYLIGDARTREAAVIDPVLETVDRDYKLIQELGLKLLYAFDTHVHADHVTGAGRLRKLTGCKTAISEKAGVTCADMQLTDGQEIKIGNKTMRAIATPGHTDTCMSFYFDGMLFTGDALLIRSAGRTDFQQGSSDRLFESVRKKLFTLPDETRVYPAHDYKGLTSTTIAEEKKWNPRLGESKSKEEFGKIMAGLNLAPPKKIDIAVPANMKCGDI